jgi:plastocyanin
VNNQRAVLTSLLLALAIAACARKESSGGTDSAAPQGAASASSAPAAPATGKVVVVELNSDAAGNYFKPANFEAHRGDVIRFTLKSGVHNVHFLADSNAGKSNLPAASDMLQLPDQTLDIPVNFAPGTYYFQCDPHAALGMMGHVKVED